MVVRSKRGHNMWTETTRPQYLRKGYVTQAM